MKSGSGLSLRLDEFEGKFFPLAEAVKRRVPAYAHVHISTYGLQFEFPEHHFLRDIETSLPELLDMRSRLAAFTGPEFDSRRDRDLVGGLVAKEKFLSRSVISATFSLAEAFLSGLFFYRSPFEISRSPGLRRRISEICCYQGKRTLKGSP